MDAGESLNNSKYFKTFNDPTRRMASNGHHEWSLQSRARGLLDLRGSLDQIVIHAPEKWSDAEACARLVKATVGAAIVGYPYCFRSCGLGLALALIIIVLWAAELSMQFLLISTHFVGKKTYQELASYALGRPGKASVNGAIWIMNFSTLVAYLNLVTDMFSSISGSLIPPALEPSRQATLFCIILCAAWPLSIFIRNPKVLAIISRAFASFLFLLSAVLALAAMGTGSIAFGELNMWRWKGVFISLPLVAYGFTSHPAIFPTYFSLQDQSLENGRKVITNSLSLAAVIYTFVGIMGFKAFGQRTHGDILRNLGGYAPGLVLTTHRLVKVGYGLLLLTSMPSLIIPLQDATATVIRPISYRLLRSEVPSRSRELQEAMHSCAILGSAGVIAAILPNVEYVLGLAGSTASIFISFIFPAAIFLQISAHQKRKQPGSSTSPDLAWSSSHTRWGFQRRTAVVLLIFGIVSGVSCTAAILSSIKEEAAVVSLVRKLVKNEEAILTSEQQLDVSFTEKEKESVVSRSDDLVGGKDGKSNNMRAKVPPLKGMALDGDGNSADHSIGSSELKFQDKSEHGLVEPRKVVQNTDSANKAKIETKSEDEDASEIYQEESKNDSEEVVERALEIAREITSASHSPDKSEDSPPQSVNKDVGTADDTIRKDGIVNKGQDDRTVGRSMENHIINDNENGRDASKISRKDITNVAS